MRPAMLVPKTLRSHRAVICAVLSSFLFSHLVLVEELKSQGRLLKNSNITSSRRRRYAVFANKTTTDSQHWDHPEQQQQKQEPWKSTFSLSSRHHKQRKRGNKLMQQDQREERDGIIYKGVGPPRVIINVPPGNSSHIEWAASPTFIDRKDVKSHLLQEDVPPFVQKHCNLTGVDHWMVPSSDWRQRTPAFLVLGAKKAGTTGLFHTLKSHPQIIKGRTKELLYFVPKRFPHWRHGQIGNPVQVAEARTDLMTRHYDHSYLQKQHGQPIVITGEATPDYLLYSRYSSQAILCTTPWVKLIVILRDPIERLFSHYNFIRDPHRQNLQLPPFEEWVKQDIHILQKAGVLPHNLSQTREYMGSEAERQGWHRYQRTVHGALQDRPVARSLYALQLEDWFDTLRLAGRDPSKQTKVLLSNEIKSNSTVVDGVLRWLGVQENNQQEQRRGKRNLQLRKAMITHYTIKTMDPHFRFWLRENIFQPHNERLYQLLGKRFDGAFE